VFDVENCDLNKTFEELGGKSLGETLLTPTKIYVKSILALLEQVDVRAISHITGGGFYENIPRILPEGLAAKITLGTWEVPAIFPYIQKCGNIETKEMYSTYNMGAGMMMFVNAEDAEAVVEALRAAGETANIIGEVVKSDTERVILEEK
jgi:phosphoribosylformylglycinamidine cyclo-ligase